MKLIILILPLLAIIIACTKENSDPVTSPNIPGTPIVSDIPDQIIIEGATFTNILLDQFVYDSDNQVNELTWSYRGNSELTINLDNRVVKLEIPNLEWTGTETITFRASDPTGLWGETEVTFSVEMPSYKPLKLNDWEVSTPALQGLDPTKVFDVY